MNSVIAIVGRPNVGKSTLFNQLTRSRQALVADQPGLTRDRQYGHGQFQNRSFIVIDTGGINDEKETIDVLMSQQTKQAIDEASIVLFLVDARAGLTPADEQIAKALRAQNKSLFLVVNKIDGLNADIAVSDFYTLGFEQIIPIAASHRKGLNNLLETIFDKLPDTESADAVEKMEGIKLAIIGRPNVGKSTLVNRMLGEERVIVCDMPGTTRDSVFVPLERHNKRYVLIDTAGVRRRRSIKETIEKFSIVKTLQAIDTADVVLFMLDARQNVSEQDLKLLGYVLEAGKAIVIAVNKWDGLTEAQKSAVKSELSRRLVFINYAEQFFISALHGSNVGNLFKAIDRAYRSADISVPTSKLTQILQRAVEQHQPPLAKGRRIKLRYAHLGGHHPPIIVIHGNQVKSLPGSYKQYLENTFRKALKLVGTPIRILLKSGENPYAKS